MSAAQTTCLFRDHSLPGRGDEERKAKLKPPSGPPNHSGAGASVLWNIVGQRTQDVTESLWEERLVVFGTLARLEAAVGRGGQGSGVPLPHSSGTRPLPGEVRASGRKQWRSPPPIPRQDWGAPGSRTRSSEPAPLQQLLTRPWAAGTAQQAKKMTYSPRPRCSDLHKQTRVGLQVPNRGLAVTARLAFLAGSEIHAHFVTFR